MVLAVKECLRGLCNRLLYKNNTHFSRVANQQLLAPCIARALKSFIVNGSLPTGSSLSIPKAMMPALEKDRDLGHPKSRGKGKKKEKKKK